MSAQHPSVLLSFAIPTYNFGRFIEQTLTSIVAGATTLTPDQYEIVILDGGSTDETETVVSEFVKRYSNVRYVRQARRGGIDRDMAAVADMTKGEFIWLFSADDLLEQGWDRYVTPLLHQGNDVILVPATLCDIQMAPLRSNPIFRTDTGPNVVEYALTPNNGVLDTYLRSATTLEAVFSYMSAIIVRACVWQALPAREDYFGTCWAHCARLMPRLFETTKITYLSRFLIKKRSGNDSFLANGYIARIAIAVDGWDRIIQEFFSKSSYRQTLLYDALRKDMPIFLFIYAKISARSINEIRRLDALARLLFRERCASAITRRRYLLYRLVPANAGLNAMMQPFLPTLIRLRHKLRAVLS